MLTVFVIVDLATGAIVADGIVFNDGHVVVHWRDKSHSTSIWQDFNSMAVVALGKSRQAMMVEQFGIGRTVRDGLTRYSRINENSR